MKELRGLLQQIKTVSAEVQSCSWKSQLKTITQEFSIIGWMKMKQIWRIEEKSKHLGCKKGLWSVSNQNTYADDPLMCALGRNDGSIEPDQWRQGLGHPVSDHGHGAKHCTNLQHGNTHPDTHVHIPQTLTGKLSCAFTHRPKCCKQPS